MYIVSQAGAVIIATIKGTPCVYSFSSWCNDYCYDKRHALCIQFLKLVQ